jgi:hypothetical protein
MLRVDGMRRSPTPVTVAWNASKVRCSGYAVIRDVVSHGWRRTGELLCRSSRSAEVSEDVGAGLRQL